MTAQEAIKAMRIEGLEIKGNLRRFNEFLEGLAMAEEALEKQNKLTNAIEQIQELANEFQEGFYHEVHCKNREDNCEWKDCCACVLERAIEIIKEEMM